MSLFVFTLKFVCNSGSRSCRVRYPSAVFSPWFSFRHLESRNLVDCTQKYFSRICELSCFLLFHVNVFCGLKIVEFEDDCSWCLWLLFVNTPVLGLSGINPPLEHLFWFLRLIFLAFSSAVSRKFNCFSCFDFVVSRFLSVRLFK